MGRTNFPTLDYSNLQTCMPSQRRDLNFLNVPRRATRLNPNQKARFDTQRPESRVDSANSPLRPLACSAQRPWARGGLAVSTALKRGVGEVTVQAGEALRWSFTG